MTITFDITKCPECPFYKNIYKYGEWTNYCGHKNAPKEIDIESAYKNVGNNRLPKDKISKYCPIKNDIPLEEKIGHWIRQETIYGLAETCECSECGRTIYARNDEDLEDFPYCHCGAKMKGE